MKAALVGFLLACLALTPAVSAGSLTAASPPYDRVLTIPLNDWEAFFVEVPAGGGIIVTVDLMSVGSIDIYVTDRGGFTNYSDPGATEFLYNVGWTAEGTRDYNQTLTPSGAAAEELVVIVDNTDFWEGGATPSGSVVVRVQTFDGSGELGLVRGVLAFCGIGALIGIGGLGVILFLMRRKRARKAVASPAPTPTAAAPPGASPAQGPIWPPGPPPPPPAP